MENKKYWDNPTSNNGKKRVTEPKKAIWQAIRRKCLDWCNNQIKEVKYCAMDGLLSTKCPLWRYRFGIAPSKAIKDYGVEVLTAGYGDYEEPSDTPTVK